MQDLQGNPLLPCAKQNAPALCCPKIFASTWSGNEDPYPPRDDNMEKPTLSDHISATGRSASVFAALPEEVVRLLLQWMDIPSLALIIQTSKSVPSSLTHLSSDDKTWLSLTHRRFNIAISSGKMGPSRSKSYGGATWKAAYRSMAMANRIPKCRAMPSKNAVFAKGGNGSQVSIWVMVSHTDDCNTRLVHVPSNDTGSNNSTNDIDQESNNETPRDRYIELRLCIQNIKSAFRSVNIDLERATVNIIGAGGVSTAVYRPRILYESSDAAKSSALKRKKCGTARRRERECAPNSGDEASNDATVQSCITLNPFEFAVISVRVPCTPDMRYETDFLSRARCANVPVSWSPPTSSNSTSSTCTGRVGYHFDSCNATFMNEPDMWEHYIELPGSCLTLADRNHVMSV